MIRTFGWTVPILVDVHGTVIVGHGRLEAAKLLGWNRCRSSASTTCRRAINAYRIADNKLAENAGWDEDFLRIELRDLIELQPDFEITATGFEMARSTSSSARPAKPPTRLIGFRTPIWWAPLSAGVAICGGGEHRLLCGDALSREDYERLMEGEKAELVITDPPYNIKIAGNCRVGPPEASRVPHGLGRNE